MDFSTEIVPWLIRASAFLFGLAWGSFFNVAIYRWPREMSTLWPPSHCPACGKRIPPYRNIPLVSYAMLRGRAACCGASFSLRYPAVELLGGVLAIAVVERFFLNAKPERLWLPALVETVAYFSFLGGLVIATFVDLEWMEIPDEVTLPGASVGLVTAPLRPEHSVEEAALGAGGGFLVVQTLFVWIYERVTGRRGMGEGDAKLLMMIGAFLGWRGALFTLVAASVQGLAAALWILASRATATASEHTGSADGQSAHSALEEEGKTSSETPLSLPFRHMKIPFGPFLALGAVENLFFGDWLIGKYLAFFRV